MESRIEIINPYSNYIFKSHYDFDYENVIFKCKELLYSAPSEFALVTKGGSSHQNAKQPHEILELKEYFDWLKDNLEKKDATYEKIISILESGREGVVGDAEQTVGLPTIFIKSQMN